MNSTYRSARWDGGLPDAYQAAAASSGTWSQISSAGFGVSCVVQFTRLPWSLGCATRSVGLVGRTVAKATVVASFDQRVTEVKTRCRHAINRIAQPRLSMQSEAQSTQRCASECLTARAKGESAHSLGLKGPESPTLDRIPSSPRALHDPASQAGCAREGDETVRAARWQSRPEDAPPVGPR